MQSLHLSMSPVAEVRSELQLRLPANDADGDGVTVAVIPSAGRAPAAIPADDWLAEEEYVLGGYAGI